MSLLEVKNKVSELYSSWEKFKEMSENARAQYDQHKSVDPITLDQLNKINDSLDSQQDTIKQLQTAIQRPSLSSNVKQYAGYDHEHKQGFSAYLRKGDENMLRSLERKGLSTITDKDGGFFITRGAIDSVMKGINEYSPMRQICSVTIISGDALEIIEDFDNANAGWTLENEPRLETQSPTLAKKIIPVHEMYAQPKATQRLIDDASIDIEDWLSKKLTDAFMRTENASFIRGDGVGKPKGLLTYVNGKGINEVEQIKSGKKGEITNQSLFNLYYSLKENFAVKAKFLMSRAALQACRMLIDPVSLKHLWTPASEATTASTLFGCEIIQCADMPGVMNDSIPIAFGDFSSAYQIVDRQGISILRDPFTEKPFVKFYATKRVGGGVLNGQAVKLLKLSD